MNSWNFTGNIGNDAETRHIPSGEAVVGFNVAVKSGYGDKAVTTWVRCAIWGKRGEAVAPYLLKGQLVGVSGELSAREWQNKDGQTKTSIEVRVNDVQLLGKKDGQQQAAPQRQAPQQQAKPADSGGFGDFDSEIPF